MVTLMLVCAITTPAITAESAKSNHPYLLWTRKDLRALRTKVEMEDWAKQAYQEMVASTERDGEDLRLLFMRRKLSLCPGNFISPIRWGIEQSRADQAEGE